MIISDIKIIKDRLEHYYIDSTLWNILSSNRGRTFNWSNNVFYKEKKYPGIVVLISGTKICYKFYKVPLDNIRSTNKHIVTHILQ